MLQAEKLFTETFTSCNSRFAVISSFRRISELGLPSATSEIYNQNVQFSGELFNDPQYDDLFIDKKEAIEKLGSIEALGLQMAKDEIFKYTASVDAASLVFAHSIIDNAVINYCRCSAIESPEDWEKFVEKKKISIEDLKGLSKDQIIFQKVTEYIDSLDRESLLSKADKLFQICQPPTEFSPINNYKYDRERIISLDQMRHDIVHKSSSVPRLPTGNADIWFLQQTANYYMALVNYKYKLKIDPFHMLQVRQTGGPTKI